MSYLLLAHLSSFNIALDCPSIAWYGIDAVTGKTYKQVPYQSASLHVVGLPTGVSFTNPRGLRSSDLQRIIDAEHQITFTIGKYLTMVIVVAHHHVGACSSPLSTVSHNRGVCIV